MFPPTSVLTDLVFIVPLDLARQALLAAVATTTSLRSKEMRSLCHEVWRLGLPGHKTWLYQTPVQSSGDDSLSDLAGGTVRRERRG